MLMALKSVVVSQNYFLNIYKKNQPIYEFVPDLQRNLTDYVSLQLNMTAKMFINFYLFFQA